MGRAMAILILICVTRPGDCRVSLTRPWFRLPGLNDVHLKPLEPIVGFGIHALWVTGKR